MRTAEEIARDKWPLLVSSRACIVDTIRTAQREALEASVEQLQRARGESETDMRQVINWVRAILDDHGLG